MKRIMKPLLAIGLLIVPLIICDLQFEPVYADAGPAYQADIFCTCVKIGVNGERAGCITVGTTECEEDQGYWNPECSAEVCYKTGKVCESDEKLCFLSPPPV